MTSEEINMYVKIAANLGAAFAIALGVLGPTIGQGMIGSAGCKSIGEHPESANKIQTAMFTGLAMTETSSLFVFLTVILLIFVGSKL